MSATIRIALAACSVSFAVVSAANGQTPAPAPATVTKAANAEPAWYLDPRWWGIFFSGGLGAASLFLQWRYRSSDRQRESNEDEFDSDVAGPVRECFAGLRSLRSQTQAAANLLNGPKRKAAVKKLIEEDAPQALGPFASAAVLADGRLNPELAKIRDATVAPELAAAGQRVVDTVDKVIISCSARLREERNKLESSSPRARGYKGGRWAR
jgi:hypothetical protein